MAVSERALAGARPESDGAHTGERDEDYSRQTAGIFEAFNFHTFRFLSVAAVLYYGKISFDAACPPGSRRTEPGPNPSTARQFSRDLP